jgi:hypothetical protein
MSHTGKDMNNYISIEVGRNILEMYTRDKCSTNNAIKIEGTLNLYFKIYQVYVLLKWATFLSILRHRIRCYGEELLPSHPSLKLQDHSLSGTGVPRGGGVWGGSTPPKFRSFEKAWPNSQFRGISICNNLIRIRVSLLYKLSETPN